jgi:hypothetical protein
MNSPAKPTLVLADNQNLVTWNVKQVLENYFDVVPYCNRTQYDLASTLIVVDCNKKSEHFKKILNSGVKIVIDSLCEPVHTYKKNYPKLENAYVLHNPNWFWYKESLTYILDKNLYNYSPARTYRYRALMPINIQRPHRDQLIITMRPFLDAFIWSYVTHPIIKKRLPDDIESGVQYLTNDRYFNPDWYDQTCFSLVAETAVDLPEQKVFITEKTFKPIAFQHPFMIFGLCRTLEYLRNLGFVTFENLFDESYDLETNTLQRLHKIKNNVENFSLTAYDTLTQQKLQHNWKHFFNTDLIKKRIQIETINPLLEHVNSK